MKIRLQMNDDDGRWYESGSEHDPAVEVPDAIVEEWREATNRVVELEAYFEETVKPRLYALAEERAKRELEEWERTATPEQREMREMQNAMLRRWSQHLFDQVARVPR